jgi:hypothetical protein
MSPQRNTGVYQLDTVTLIDIFHELEEIPDTMRYRPGSVVDSISDDDLD